MHKEQPRGEKQKCRLEAAIWMVNLCKKGDINLNQLHLHIILKVTKFCSTFHEILAFYQKRARKQEIGHCDLMLL